MKLEEVFLYEEMALKVLLTPVPAQEEPHDGYPQEG